jgi:DNA mismatch repair protein MutS2
MGRSNAYAAPFPYSTKVVKNIPNMKSDHFAHAEAVLELHAVLGVIANACLNEGARKKITSLHPRPDREWIEHSLEEIEDMRSYLLQQGDIPLADTSWGEMLDDAVQGHLLLEGKALLAIADLERTVMALKHSFKKKADQFPLLYGLVGALTSHEILLREIESAIEKDGTVLDGASKELASFRKKIASSREQLRHAAESSAQGYGDKAYATVLDGRFKLLIPRDRFRRRDGIVHSASHSGESVYFEPFQLVEKNNALEALLQSEKTEEMRILRVITGSVLAAANELINNIDGVEKLDVLRAKSIYGSRFKCISPAPSHGASLRLVDARHPLLEIAFQAASNGVVERDSEKGSRKKHQRQEQTAGSVVPLDLEIKEKEPILVITGPNAGGKTVALKTVGIVVLLYQCGLQVPCAQGTAIPVFGKIFADIGDEQSIDSSLSTFTSHLRHLDTMCREADRNTLCLIDEIGDGTDPDEGAALANATLEKLLGLGSIAIATTHYSKVKTHAMMTEGLSNASMLFNDETQEPLYVLMQGMPRS